MATTAYIEPFPNDVDRCAFGNWLSGFCDGEACFIIQVDSRSTHVGCHAFIRIQLRDDDLDILRMIQSYWQCGNIYKRKRISLTRHNNPNCEYVVSGWRVLTSVVIPHFEQYPLRAKKSKDFVIWKDAVEFANTVSLRGTGGVKKWSDVCLDVFSSYVSLIKQGRAYKSIER